jgi:probable HAF family extracellular repeat protein
MRALVLPCALVAVAACSPVDSAGSANTGGQQPDAGSPPTTDGGTAQGEIDGGRPVQRFGLSIGVNGQGSVRSSPAGVDCGPTCAASFDEGTSVALSAIPASGFRFDGWGGACSGPGGCTVTMQSDTQVWATFVAIPPAQHALTVILTGTGGGTISSKPAGIDCGGSCSATFTDGTTVTLTPTAANGSQFDGWGGACTGTGGCAVTMNREQVVAARFQPVAPPPPKLAYAITEIPAIDGGTSFLPNAIDSAGDIVGNYYVSADGGVSQTRAFLYDAGKRSTARIGGGDGSTIQMANGINDSLSVALTTDTLPGIHNHGFLWSGGKQTDIGALPPGPNGPQTAATAINQRGLVTGWSLGAKNFQRAVLWDGKTLQDLGSADDKWSYGHAINIDGVVAGATTVANDPTHEHAAVFQGGKVKDLGTLGPYPSTAFAINDRGRVVGSSMAGTKAQLHAFVYDLPDGPMRDVSPDKSCWLNGVNNGGDAVGACRTAEKATHAVIWHDGAFVDLNDAISDPSWLLTGATAINGRGQIAAIGSRNGGAFQPVLLTPR